MGRQPRPLCLLSFFSNTNLQKKTVGFTAIRTRIVRVEGEHADHNHGPRHLVFEPQNLFLIWLEFAL